MNVLTHKSKIAGSVRAPASKSYTIRALMCAAMAHGNSRIYFALDSDDTKAAVDVLRICGVQIVQDRDTLLVKGGIFHRAQAELFCRDSATTLRFMTAIASIIPGKTRLVSGPSLMKRPIEPLIQVLRQIGVNCYLCKNEPTVVVESDELKGGVVHLEGNVSSQFLSALLLVSPFAENGLRIILNSPIQSRPYILMTLECLKQFGIHVDINKEFNEFIVSKQSFSPTEYCVEGDWSSASYLLALGALAGEIEVTNLNSSSVQGDKILLEYLKKMDAAITENEKSVMVQLSELRAINADLKDYIDLLPTMAILAATASGTSELVGISRGRIKESNRVAAVVQGLRIMGLEVLEEEERLLITGNNLRDSIIDSFNDHRIAMAFAILGMKTGGIAINNADCVAKSFPEFWEVIKHVGGRITVSGK